MTSFHGIVVRTNHRRAVRTSGRASSQVEAVAAATAKVNMPQATSRPRCIVNRRAGSAAASAISPAAARARDAARVHGSSMRSVVFTRVIRMGARLSQAAAARTADRAQRAEPAETGIHGRILRGRPGVPGPNARAYNRVDLCSVPSKESRCCRSSSEVSMWTGRRHTRCRFWRVSRALATSRGTPSKACFRYSSPRLA